MTEVLWLGRGGQGAFTAAKLLGAAYVLKGSSFHALAFPSFGPERRGAPVRAFTKLDTKPVLDRSETEKADYIIILDDTLYSESLANHLKENGRIIINSKTISGDNITAYDAEKIAAGLELPTVNTIMLGIAASLSGITGFDELSGAINQYMPEKIRDKNITAVREAFE